MPLETLRNFITSPPVLSQFKPNCEIVVQCDAAKDGLGCVLLQNNNKPIAFASKSMTLTETSYAQFDKELLSLLFACRKFHYYI